MKRFLIVLILIFSFLGLADSAYIFSSENSGTPLLCNINGLSGCNVVAESPYSSLFGIPLSEYGLAFYGLLFVLAGLELFMSQSTLRRLIQVIAALGLIASAYFTIIQVTVINALCIYCMVSAAISLILFIIAFFVESLRTRPPLPPV